ncbi:UPS3 (YDR185C) and UPS2 (YLR168C) [Zygosaccharomyces parabailii]|nr:UPS3 (YDR185C) and UPS2 (YLR168C) [Zygosaccharomyces parabailii]CDH09515.1 probable protein UPS2, mitochondrial [Zygosaccharomyces bailii ISA1307]
MKLFQNSYDFNYPWEQITAANWKKYPNEVSTHVIAVDVLRRELHHQGRQLVTERLITVKQGVPKWAMMIVGGSNLSYVREVSVVDLDAKTLTLRSCNLTYSNILKVFETVKYSPHPVDPEHKTLFNQEAQITAYGAFTKLCNKLEDFSVQRFRDNAMKGKQGFDSVLEAFSARWDKVNDAVGESHSAIINGNFGLIHKAFRKESS